MNDYYLMLGSNIDREVNLPRAAALLAERVRLCALSPVYETEPVGAAGDAPFFNAAARVQSPLSATALRETVLRPIEHELGRVRTTDKNAPRPIDIDIVLMNHEVRSLGNRTIPDPDILTQAYVAAPLADIAPDYVHPVTGKTLAAIASELDARGIRAALDLTHLLD